MTAQAQPPILPASDLVPGDDAATGMPEAQHNDALRALYTRIVDAKAGFEVMVDKAEPAFRPYAQKFHDLHARHAGEVAGMLNGNVGDPEGSFMGTVNKTVVSLRALFDEIDEDVMDQVRSGERSVLEAFSEAEHASPAIVASELVRMRAELEALLQTTSHLD